MQKNDGLNIRACVQRGTLKLNRALLLFRDRLLHESSGLRGVQHQNCSRRKKPAVKQKGPPLGRRDDSVAFRHFLVVRAALFSANLVWSWPWMKRLALNSNSLFNQPAHKPFPQNQCCPCNSGGGGGGSYITPSRWESHTAWCVQAAEEMHLYRPLSHRWGITRRVLPSVFRKHSRRELQDIKWETVRVTAVRKTLLRGQI